MALLFAPHNSQQRQYEKESGGGDTTMFELRGHQALPNSGRIANNSILCVQLQPVTSPYTFRPSHVGCTGFNILTWIDTLPATMEDDKKQKRARSQLSCDQCRQQKLKCDRNRPCDQCEKRNRGVSCTYKPPALKSRARHDVKGRVRQLEKLVVDLMNSKNLVGHPSISSSNNRGSSVAGETGSRGPLSMLAAQESHQTPPDSEGECAAQQDSGREDTVSDLTLGTFGQLKVNGDETSYVGSIHWASVLASISDLKRELDEDEEVGDDLPQPELWRDEGNTQGTKTNHLKINWLLHSPLRLTREELIEALPPKAVADRLVSMWFNSADPFKPIIHKPQFQIEYQQFWKDFGGATTMWISLLYSILALGCFFQQQGLRGPSSSALFAEAERYHNLSGAAAVLADYTSPKAYAIEGLILYVGMWRTQTDAFDLWVLMGTIIRLALRMGYHRDSRHYDTLSVYAGEMRRRVYGALYMADVLISFSLGLPAMLRTIQSDTAPPHNLLDQDFGPLSKILPAPRPLDELTPASYAGAKVRICRVFSNAAELSHATTTPLYSQVMEVEEQLEAARLHIPPPMRAQTLDSSITDTPETLLCGTNLEILCLKTKCVLHRRFMTSTPNQQAHPYSRKTCIDSALQILRYHHFLTAAMQPGGQLETVSWYLGTLGTSDFLLAAMILCLELSTHCGVLHLGSPEDGKTVSRDELIEALEKTKAIWEDARYIASQDLDFGGRISSGFWRDVTKACKAVAIMLERVKGVRAESLKSVTDGQNSRTPPSSQDTSQPLPWQAHSFRGNDWNEFSPHDPFALGDETMIANMISSTNNDNWVSLYAYTGSMQVGLLIIQVAWEQQFAAQQTQEVMDWSLEGMMDDVNLTNIDLTPPFDKYL